MRRVHPSSLVFAAALALLPWTTADAGAQTFKPKFGKGSWTAFGSVRRPQDDLWTPGTGPGGEFWQSPGGAWQPTPGSPIRNPRADTWTPVKPNARRSKRGAAVGRPAGERMNSTTVVPPASPLAVPTAGGDRGRKKGAAGS
jgi:hypothetical protein